MLRCGSANRHTSQRYDLARCDADGIPTTETTGYRGRRQDRDVPRQRVQRAVREMVSVSVGQEHRVQRREPIERDTGRRDAAEDAGEPPIEIRIREHAHAADLDQQRGVPDVRYPRAGAALAADGAFAAFARSLDRNHCCGNVAMFWTA